jgi:hypothetical protein
MASRDSPSSSANLLIAALLGDPQEQEVLKDFERLAVPPHVAQERDRHPLGAHSRERTPLRLGQLARRLGRPINLGLLVHDANTTTVASPEG